MLGNLNIKKNLFSNIDYLHALMFILGGLGQSLYYSQPFLHGNDCNSNTFLREISYKVNLTGTYKPL